MLLSLVHLLSGSCTSANRLPGTEPAKVAQIQSQLGLSSASIEMYQEQEAAAAELKEATSSPAARRSLCSRVASFPLSLLVYAVGRVRMQPVMSLLWCQASLPVSSQ